MKIAVIGCGHIFQVGHGPALNRYQNEYKDISLYACCDINNEMTEKAQKQYGFKYAFSNVDKMLEETDLDAIILCLPTKYITETAMRILKKKIPVLIEKPPGANLMEAQQIQEVVKQYGTFHEIAFNRRSMPLVKEFKKTLEGRQIQYIKLDFFRYNRKETTFYETAIHGIDLIRYISNSPYKELNILYRSLDGTEDGSCNMHISCQLESGAYAELAFCPQSGAVVERVVVNAQDYTGFLNLPVWGGYDTPGSAAMVVAEQVCQTTDKDTEMFITNGFYGQIEGFLNRVKAGEKPKSQIETCVQDMQIFEALKRRETRIVF